MFVIEYNIDLHVPYIYDMYADHSYEPYTNYNPSKHTPLFIDFGSFPCAKPSAICEKLGLDLAKHPRFCLLDEYYFFRTILQSESDRPTVVLRDENLYRKTFTFEEFMRLFAQTYRIIYTRWKAFDMDPDVPLDTSFVITPSMRTMFRVRENDEQTLSFREWLQRVHDHM